MSWQANTSVPSNKLADTEEEGIIAIFHSSSNIWKQSVFRSNCIWKQKQLFYQELVIMKKNLMTNLYNEVLSLLVPPSISLTNILFY